MKKSAFLAALMASVAFGPFPADAKSKLDAAAATTIQFQMHVSAGAAKCLPKAIGYVSDHTIGPVEYLSVYVTGLPPNTDFDFFVIQVPIAPFGLSWYQGDIETDAKGNGTVSSLVGSISKPSLFLLVRCRPRISSTAHLPSSLNPRRVRTPTVRYRSTISGCGSIMRPTLIRRAARRQKRPSTASTTPVFRCSTPRSSLA
jgi:hypothetical protein